MNAARQSDPEVISWDICEQSLSDGSKVYDVVGTSDECRVTLNCADEKSAEDLVAFLDSYHVCGARAERLQNGAPGVPDKVCTKCRESWPADLEFFRRQPKPRQPNRLAPWCRACESEQRRSARAIATAAITKAGGKS
jgi:hypothetical protein